MALKKVHHTHYLFSNIVSDFKISAGKGGKILESIFIFKSSKEKKLTIFNRFDILILNFGTRSLILFRAGGN